MKKRIHSIEALETRIAPATLLVQPLGYDVYKDGGVLAGQTANELAAKNFAIAENAVFLATGDRLVFDLNGNKKADGGEPVAVQVTSGQAMVILADFDADHVFDRNDIGTLFVGGTFGGVINGDIGDLGREDSGCIVTALDANGAVTAGGGDIVVQDSAIDGLTVNGVLGGSIIAGDFIAHVKTGKPTLFSADRPGAAGIYAGVPGFSFDIPIANGGGVGVDHSQIVGDGPSISDVNLATGVTRIVAGKGAGLGNSGGSVERITILNQAHGLGLFAGVGTTGPNGGSGGALEDVKVATTGADSAFTFASGSGGKGSAGDGGDAGILRNVTVSGKSILDGITFTGGQGGQGAPGLGGKGGSVENISVDFGVVSASIGIVGGSGGFTSGPTGGTGGNISKVRVKIATMDEGSIYLNAGDGGSGHGNLGTSIGGSVSDFQITSTDFIATSVLVRGGNGSDSAAGGAVVKGTVNLAQFSGQLTIRGGDGASGTSGGAGGAVNDIALTSKSLIATSYSVIGGDGGRGSTGNGGDGGKVSKIKATVGVATTLHVSGGEGGSATTAGGIGKSGDGGTVEDVTFAAQRITSEVIVAGGDSSSEFANAGTTTAGSGGNVARVKVAAGFAEAVSIRGGTSLFEESLTNGGRGGSASDISIAGAKFGSLVVAGGDGTGGGASHGGDVARLKIAVGTVAESMSLSTGNGGSEPGFLPRIGGDGGRFIGANTISISAPAKNLTVRGGDGGDGNDGDGGAGGGIGGTDGSLTITTNAMNNVSIFGGDGGAGSGEGTGGTGGTLSFKFTAKGAVNNFTVASGRGGDSAGAAAGTAGAVERSTFVIPAITGTFAITGGRGGDVTATGGNAGGGGGLSSLAITVPGVVAENMTLTSGRGGSVNAGAGSGGGGGTISDVKISAGSVFGTGGSLEAGVVVTSGAGSAGSGGGSGGAGGDIERVSIGLKLASYGVRLISGEGGVTSAGAPANGGNGGNISSATVTVSHLEDTLYIESGAGRAGIGIGGNGGNGGNISGLVLKGSQIVTNGVVIRTGEGGRATNNNAHTGNGGNGGDILNPIIALKTAIGFSVTGGNGGDSGAGGGNSGNGGSIIGGSLRFANISHGEVRIAPGASGIQRQVAGFVAGHGGDITDTLLEVTAGAMERIIFFGSSVSISSSDSGRGGNISNVTLNLGKDTIVKNDILILGGSAAESFDGTGGAGGSVSGVTVNESGTFGSLSIRGGEGGRSEQIGSGDGGSVEQITLNISGSGSSFLDGRVDISGGSSGSTEDGTCGSGGDVRDVTIKQTGRIGHSVQIHGGTAFSGNVTAGTGGDIERVKITDPTGQTSYELNAGGGGSSNTLDGNTGGSIRAITFDAPKATFTFVAGVGGAAQRDGGIGGSIEKLTGKAASVSAYGGSGGLGTTGAGGSGGDIVDFAVSARVDTLLGGAGGAGATTGGAGGDISRMKIVGDIGNFGFPFGTLRVVETGGLFAGKGGAAPTPGINGSITTVSATRISAIMAADTDTFANALTSANAVTAIANVIATKIGADFDSDGTFDFIDAGAAGFGLGQGDTALDGLVIAKAAGVTATSFSTAPLRVATV